MSTVKTFVRAIVASAGLSNRVGIFGLNLIYPRLPHRWRVFIANQLHTMLPRTDFVWTATLKNGRSLRVPVASNSSTQWDFVLALPTYDIGLVILDYLLSQYYPEGTTYFDIGANQGLHTFTPACFGHQVYMFEPNRQVTEFSKTIMKTNNISNIAIINAALSDTEGNMPFHVSKNTYTSTLNDSLLPEESIVETIDVDVVTLDSFLEENGLPPPKWIKMDVEGHERSVLMGGARLLANHKPTLILEIESFLSPAELIQLLDMLNQYGYQGFSICNSDPLSLVAVSGPRDVTSQSTTNFLFTCDETLLANLAPLIE